VASVTAATAALYAGIGENDCDTSNHFGMGNPGKPSQIFPYGSSGGANLFRWFDRNVAMQRSVARAVNLVHPAGANGRRPAMGYLQSAETNISTCSGL
jgi:hypothetical protein